MSSNETITISTQTLFIGVTTCIILYLLIVNIGFKGKRCGCGQCQQCQRQQCQQCKQCNQELPELR
jgi:hypothetical protein